MLRLRTIRFVLLDDDAGLEYIDVVAMEVLRLVELATSVGRAGVTSETMVIEVNGEILVEELVRLSVVAGEEAAADVLSGTEKIAEALPRWM